MKADWTEVTLGEACTIRPPKSDAREKVKPSDGVSFVPMEDLPIGHKLVQAQQTRKMSEVEGSYTYFGDGDVLLAKITPCFENGKLGVARGLTNGIGFGSSEFVVLRPKPNILSEYLYYYLVQDSFRAEGIKTMGGAVGQQRIDKDFVPNHKVPLPPLNEQRRIAAILDEAFAAITTVTANTEKSLASAGAVFAAHVEGVFGRPPSDWDTRRLGGICEFVVGQSPPGTSYNTAGSGVPLINGPDEFGGADAFAETRATKFTTEPTKMCRKGDLILCVRGSTTGRMNIAAHDACVGRGVVAIRSSDYQQWLKYFISFSRQAIYRLGSGSTFPNVSSAQLKDVVVPIPPRAEQARIIDHLTALRTDIRRLEELFRSKFLMAQRLKQSLLYKAFSGELTSRGSAFAKDAAE